MNRLRTLPPPLPRPAAQPRVERLAAFLVVASVCTLETLPIFCWLLALAAHDFADPNSAAIPFWWMWLLVFAVRWLGVFFSRGTDDNPGLRRTNTLLLALTVAVLGIASLLVTYRLSPATQAFLASSGDSSGAVAVALLVVWLWGRGLFLGRGRLTRERMYRVFIVALGATIAALAVASVVPASVRDLTMSYLSLLLALLLFAGLMGLTLAQVRDATYTMRSSYRGSQPMATPPLFSRAWLAASLGMSLGVSLLTLLLATVVSHQSIRMLAVAAGNIWAGLTDALQFVLSPILALAYLVLNGPITWLANLFHGLQRHPLTIPPPPPSCGAGVLATPVAGGKTPCVPPAHTPTTSLVPSEWSTVIHWGLDILIVVVALVLLVRLLRRFAERRRVQAFSEERATLDIREILGARFRRFFDNLRSPKPADDPATDDLAAGTVRKVYRDTLAAAAAAGSARQAAETPREYQRRITSSDGTPSGAEPPPVVAGALGALTLAYEQARYGQPDADVSPPATPETLTAAETVRRWLAGQSGQSGQ